MDGQLPKPKLFEARPQVVCHSYPEMPTEDALWKSAPESGQGFRKRGQSGRVRDFQGARSSPGLDRNIELTKSPPLWLLDIEVGPVSSSKGV